MDNNKELTQRPVYSLRGELYSDSKDIKRKSPCFVSNLRNPKGEHVRRRVMFRG
tara:strand:- start:3996 stop:4157 length:162 start_codon:yes stop_codon:yes gene_type:complete